MLFDAIFIDVFNLAYRKSSSDDYKKIANDFIDFINKEAKSHLDGDGTIYLLFDPLPKSDLGLSKSFRYSPRMRNAIVSSYKKNRFANPCVGEAVKLLKKYYTFRGDKIKICISDNLEADDFVEQLLQKEKGNVALVTTDSDWARYISDRTVMLNKGFDKPYTKEHYLKDNGMIPTVATVTLKKAIFGDASDNIDSIFDTKKNYYEGNIEDVANAMLFYIAKENLPFKEVESHLKEASFQKLFKIPNRNPLEEFEYCLIAIDPNIGSPYNSLLDNIRVIKSRCDNVDKYITCKPEDPKVNMLMDNLLGRTKSSKKPLTFGTLKA
jgi:hypothetical protein